MFPLTLRSATIEDHERLQEIWLQAVRATHSFLSEDDIQFYLPLLREQYFHAVELWVATDRTEKPVGFLGLSGSKIEMLFVDPAHHGQGIGRKLLAFVAAFRENLTVDVNEQNPGARIFYEKCGFREIGRSEFDDQGKPFPLIHLAASSGRPMV